MKFEELETYYKNSYDFQRQTCISNVNWYRWKKKGYIPYFSQRRIEKVTDGLFKASIYDAPDRFIDFD